MKYRIGFLWSAAVVICYVLSTFEYLAIPVADGNVYRKACTHALRDHAKILKCDDSSVELVETIGGGVNLDNHIYATDP